MAPAPRKATPADSPHNRPRRLPGSSLGVSATVRLGVAFLVGVVAGSLVAFLADWRDGLLGGWITAAAVFVIWMWLTIGPMDAAATRAHAACEDTGRQATDIVVVTAAVASLVAVGLVLTGGTSRATSRDVQAAVSVCSVAFAWGALHTMFTTRYARLYYTGSGGGIDFNQDDPPRYTDFAYLAFTIGMTYQVSDTNLGTKEIRLTALRQALLSYLFGSVVIATTINLVAGLGR